MANSPPVAGWARSPGSLKLSAADPTGAAAVPPALFADVLARHAAASPDRLAFVFLDARGNAAERLTFGALQRHVAEIGDALAAIRIEGRHVLLLFPPGLDFVAALFACFRAGVVAVPVPFTAGRRTEDRFVAICRDAGPAAVLTASHFKAADKARALLAGSGHSVPWVLVDDLGQPGSLSGAAVPVGRDTPALLQYTSGSTGTPKGVVLSHGNLVANNAMVAASFGHDETSRGIGWLPLYHDMGLVGHVLQPVFVGGLSVLMSPFAFLQRPRSWLEAISAWRITTTGGPSYGYTMCMRAIAEDLPPEVDLSSWKVAYCGAEKVRGDVLAAFAARFAPNGFNPAALHPCYGLAEATLLVSSVGRGGGIRTRAPAAGIGAAARSSEMGAPGSVGCGRAWEEGRIEIADPDGGRLVPDGVVGEIRVRGPHVASGYWGHDNETAAAFQTDAEGRFLRTGDLGFLSDGELFVVGRLKDIIIAVGVKYAAEDIEATVARSDPAFTRMPCAAFAVDGVDREAVIVVQEVSSDSGPDALAQAADRARAAVTAEHGLRLTDLRLVRKGSLPCTTSGKVQRGRTRTLYIEGGLPQIGGPARQDATPTPA